MADIFSEKNQKIIKTAWKTFGSEKGRWIPLEYTAREYAVETIVGVLKLYFNSTSEEYKKLYSTNIKLPDIVNEYPTTDEGLPCVAVVIADGQTYDPELGTVSEGRDDIAPDREKIVMNDFTVQLKVGGRDTRDADQISGYIENALLTEIMPALALLDPAIILANTKTSTSPGQPVRHGGEFVSQMRTITFRIKIDFTSHKFIVAEPVLESVDEEITAE